MEFTSSDLIFTRELLRKGSIDIMALHKEYLLSPAQIVDSLARLESIGIVERNKRDDGVVRIAKNGPRQLISYRRKLVDRAKDWKNVPISMMGPTVAVNAPYTPAYKKLGKSMRSRQRRIRKEMKDREHAG